MLAIFLAPVTDVTLAQQLFRSAAGVDRADLVGRVSTLITLAAIMVLGIASLLVARAAAGRGKRPK